MIIESRIMKTPRVLATAKAKGFVIFILCNIRFIIASIDRELTVSTQMNKKD